jgi:diguanylate cyclase (GGDEF)-like protein
MAALGNQALIWKSWRLSSPRAFAILGLSIVLAIGCVFSAVFISAHHADEAAAQRERHLLEDALNGRRAQLAREVEHVALSYNALQRFWTRFDAAVVNYNVQPWLKPPYSDSYFVVVDPLKRTMRSIVRPLVSAPSDVEFEDLKELLDAVAALRAYGDIEGANLEPRAAHTQTRILMLLGRPAVAAASILSEKPGERSNEATPVAVMARFISPEFLTDLALQFGLGGLRLVPAGTSHAAYETSWGASGTPFRFHWIPQKPGSGITRDVAALMAAGILALFLLIASAVRTIKSAASKIETTEDRLKHQATHDSLSNLPNRTLFAERLEKALVAAKSGAAHPALLTVDLDHFKDVNDLHGHHVGDALIVSVAERLRAGTGPEDTVARLGGDEFAVIIADIRYPDTNESAGQRIMDVFAQPFAIGPHTIVGSASVGIAPLDGRTVSIENAMRFADLALYRAKNEGRARTCIYDAAMNAAFLERKQLEHDLRRAIDDKQLHLAYQPVVNSNGHTRLGVEALCRWTHPTLGPIPPSRFIPVAECGELIVPLGQWVMRQACIDARAWPDLTVAVNVSPVQFRRPDFVDSVQAMLVETGFDPARLELEITESTLIGNLDTAKQAMLRLKAIGVKLALDDFGTGYSSLLYLRKLPFDKLKIDHTFTASIESAADAASIVHAIVSLGRGLGMKVTAEGVENSEQQLFLRAAGVHSMQGYHFGRPVSAAEISASCHSPTDTGRHRVAG